MQTTRGTVVVRHAVISWGSGGTRGERKMEGGARGGRRCVCVCVGGGGKRGKEVGAGGGAQLDDSRVCKELCGARGSPLDLSWRADAYLNTMQLAKWVETLITPSGSFSGNYATVCEINVPS